MPVHEPVDPTEIAAYLDEQLDTAQRIALESALSRNPAAAAQVMADLRMRDELRLAMAGSEDADTRHTSTLARRLQSRLDRNHWLRRLRPLVAASVLLVTGWVANGQLGGAMNAQASASVPEYVTVAIEAHRNSALRARMISQVESPEYDAAELLAETAITMPSLPDDWVVTDVQVYPSRFGPSVEMAVDAGALGMISIFATRPGQDVVVPPIVEQVDETTTAYWQFGEIAYALVSRSGAAGVTGAAEMLYDTLF